MYYSYSKALLEGTGYSINKGWILLTWYLFSSCLGCDSSGLVPRKLGGDSCDFKEREALGKCFWERTRERWADLTFLNESECTCLTMKCHIGYRVFLYMTFITQRKFSSVTISMSFYQEWILKFMRCFSFFALIDMTTWFFFFSLLKW